MYSNRLEIEYGDTGGGPLSRDISVVKIEALLAYMGGGRGQPREA